MNTYTVFAVTSTDDPHTFLVAGVVAGVHNALDSDPYDEPWCRFAQHVDAANPTEAEVKAEQAYRAVQLFEEANR